MSLGPKKRSGKKPGTSGPGPLPKGKSSPKGKK